MPDTPDTHQPDRSEAVVSGEAHRMVHFWRSMQYLCDTKRHLFTMWLEDGCEGPREKEVRIPDPFRKSDDGMMTWWATEGGRLIIPVPFVVRCWCGQGATHVRWNEDQDEDVTHPESFLRNQRMAFPHFRYDDRETPDRCGIPRGPS